MNCQFLNGFKNIASEQAHRGALAAEREKEGELHLWNLNISIEKVDAKC